MALRLATRGSKLALAQAGTVAALLDDAELVEASSDGEPGDKSRFVRAVERELLEGRADIGVHSAKDLPAALPEGLVIAGVPARETAEDAWLGKGSTLDGVPEHATVGTSSLRRRAQILARRPDLEVVELHGNVDTRLRPPQGQEARRDRARRRGPAPPGPREGHFLPARRRPNDSGRGSGRPRTADARG